ncbi:MAG TPA: hypothetical protein VGL71_09275 [Urbifossiella sp.]|jgi:hypothetical protein
MAKKKQSIYSGTTQNPYPAIDSPCSGDTLTVPPTTLIVQVSSNRPDVPHTISLINIATSTIVSGPVPVVFSGTKGSATISIPTPGPTSTDYLIQCSPTSGTSAQIVVTVPASAPPPGFGVSISASAASPYVVGQTVQFTANPSGGMPPYTWTWVGTGITGSKVAPSIDVLFSAPTPMGAITVSGTDSTMPTHSVAAAAVAFVVDASHPTKGRKRANASKRS